MFLHFNNPHRHQRCSTVTVFTLLLLTLGESRRIHKNLSPGGTVLGGTIPDGTLAEEDLPAAQYPTKRTAGGSEQGAVVEEVFGRSGIIQADESRRIYAISIPRIFQDDRGGGGHYHPPVYRAQASREQQATGFTTRGQHALPQPLPPPSPFPGSARQPWQSGLRLIVSGPVEDHSPLPRLSDERHPSYEYGLVPDDEQYYDSHYDERPRDHSIAYEDDDRYYHEDIVEEEDPQRPLLPKQQQNPLPQRHNDARQYYNDRREDEERRLLRAEQQEPPNRFFNRPYPKLTEPYSVLDAPINKKKKNQVKITLPIEPAPSDDYYNDENNPVIPQEQAAPTDYYDNLYEEFMEAAYDAEYYDQLDSLPNNNNKKNNPKAANKPKDRQSPPSTSTIGSTTILDYEDSRMEEPSATITRRDPPSDMYTTSRSTVPPETSVPTSTEKMRVTKHRLDDTPLSTQESQDTRKTDGNVDRPRPSTTTKLVPSSTTRRLPAFPPTTSRPPVPPTIEQSTTQASQIRKPVNPYKSSSTESLISLSEILQSIGISLPQFLVQLKMHGSDLKKFTTKLEKRALSRLEFKRAQGNVGELLKILEEASTNSNKPSTTTASPYTTKTPTFRKLTFGFTERRPEDMTTETISSSSTKLDVSSTSQSTTESTTTSSTTTTKKPPPPKRFGFRPSSKVEKDGAKNLPANVVLASSSATTVTTTESSLTTTSESVIYRPYKPVGGGWRDRMQHNRGVSSRLGTTTRRPKFRPNYTYNGGNTDLLDLINSQDDDGDEPKKEMIEIEVVALETSPDKEDSRGRGLSNSGSNVVGLTEGTPLGGAYDHPRYDRDPNSLNIATRSAIMAAGVLGGIALAVFLTILIFVMYKNHVGRRRRRLRVPFPLSIASDDSSTSTPPLYTTRSRAGFATRSSSQTDFWGTLKRKFDPYSISSTSASYY